MPNLLTFAPCDNVLLGQDSSVSLIQILNQIQVSGEIPDPLPLNAATQLRWFVFAQWEIAPEEIGREFEQDVRLVRGEEAIFHAGSNFIPEAGKPIHRMIGSLSIFPLVPAGVYRLTIYIREVGENNAWQKAGDYPIEVVYRQIAVPA